MQFSEFFKKYARDKGVEIAEKVLKEVTRVSSKQYPPASLPGKPPARRTGKFVASGTIIRTKNGALLRWYAPYSGFLQHGTKHMAPRPYLTIALANVLKSKKLKKEVDRKTKGRAGKVRKPKQAKGIKRKQKTMKRKQRQTKQKRRR